MMTTKDDDKVEETTKEKAKKLQTRETSSYDGISHQKKLSNPLEQLQGCTKHHPMQRQV